MIEQGGRDGVPGPPKRVFAFACSTQFWFRGQGSSPGEHESKAEGIEGAEVAGTGLVHGLTLDTSTPTPVVISKT